ncbi:DNA repair protein XRCC4 [Madurella mycetomatis]|uniref:DNA repair protein XRCC4 n=1 Tax=Madurella mycetomatis TaxID=100816 RepID=A0A175WC25_9PEZI|nr:DNA repair protein XRCC4 [Madurella mycetomatis]
MASSHIIRVPRTDEEGAYVLGEVTPSGSKPLNVKFVATEGREPYVVKLRHDRIGELRASSSPCSPEEWESILKALLLRGEPVDGIEAGAEANVGKSITITIRRRIAGINQRLGALTLNHKADEAIELFDWCGAAALERETLQETLAAETAKVSDLEFRVAELRNQLDELTNSKKERESEMLEKFCSLLNEKKVKIREQQRLLSTAHVDPSRIAAVQAAQAARSTNEAVRKPAASRRTKRKALEDASGGGSSDSDDGFEKVAADKMDIDPKTEPTAEPREGNESEDRQTTDDDATDSEPDEGEALPPSPPPKSRQQPKPTPKGRATRASQTAKGKDVAIHPPKRNLGKAAPKPASPPPGDGSETESDDEL